MVSQQRKAVVVLVVALCFGYWYTSPGSDSTIYFSGKIPHVSLDQLNTIRYSHNMDRKLTAFVLGATGAVGKEIVNVLAADDRFEKVTLIGRRPVALNPGENPGHKKIENQIIDFDKLDEHKDVFKGYDVGFSSLGSQ